MASWDKAAGWDPVGLQIGDPSAPANRVAVCHEVNERVVDEGAGYDLVVTYHPLLFRPVDRLIAGRSAEGRALRLIALGTAVAAVHTNFDAAPGGTADSLAAALDLKAPVPFGPMEAASAVKIVTFIPEDGVGPVADAMAAAGAGDIGAYSRCSFRAAGTGTFYAGEGTAPAVGASGELNSEPEIRLEMVAPRAQESAVVSALVAAHPYEEPAFDVYDVRANAGMVGRIGSWPGGETLQDLSAACAEVLRTSVRFAGQPESKIDTVAVVPGAGSEFIPSAQRTRADAIVTGDVSHHRAVAAVDGGLAVVDAGHIPTERPGVISLYASVSEILPEVDDLTWIESHPWKEA